MPISEKILFVDDDPNILASFKRTLRKRYDLDTAVGPEEGLEVVGRYRHYALVVSDLRMPVMNGTSS